jgi:hypothetical protein
MSQTGKLLVGAVTDFIITAGGVLTGGAAAQGSIALPGQGVIFAAIVFGIVAAAKHVRGMMLEPEKL